MRRISVSASAVPAVWTWLEKSNVSLVAMIAWNSEKMTPDTLVKDMTAPLKRGSDGVQLYVKFKDMEKLTEHLREIIPEIFFDKSLSIALSLDDVPYNGWQMVFEYMEALKATNIMLISKNIKTMDAAYYNFLDNLMNPRGFGIELCCATDSIKPLEDAYRMTQKMLPGGLSDLRLIVRPEFMKNYKCDYDEDL
jgi:hypothetical protein